LGWIQRYERIGNTGIVCLKRGISCPTLRKWLNRYEHYDVDGLNAMSRQPHSSPAAKVFPKLEKMILEMRKTRKLGHRRLCNELNRLHDVSLSIATILNVLRKHDEPYLQKKRHYRKKTRCYSRTVPGD